ncbi:MAG: cyclic nucleotide-binding domain-containing protein [Alphaproteobacteria bacterium]|nr:cyclic nucleotide-binding domain-containing protein [Alphaproteobacteria bacterium]MCB9794518.1 cyclic nucleotide-binding domain-containing protein [Alphaproteobacteria bacterium]
MSLAWLVHAANIAILVSFLLRDILWLRLLSILAGLFFIPYFLLQPTPMLEPVVWNGLFIGINAVQIVRLFRERRPVHLDAEQARLRALAFPGLSPRQVLALLSVGEWQELAAGQRACVEGERGEALMILVSGRLQVRACERGLGELAPGAFVGEMAYLTGDCSSATVQALEPCRLMRWSYEPLRAHLKVHPELHAAVQAVLGADLARKLGARTAA